MTKAVLGTALGTIRGSRLDVETVLRANPCALNSKKASPERSLASAVSCGKTGGGKGREGKGIGLW
jgi:hypothetical protein